MDSWKLWNSPHQLTCQPVLLDHRAATTSWLTQGGQLFDEQLTLMYILGLINRRLLEPKVTDTEGVERGSGFRNAVNGVSNVYH